MAICATALSLKRGHVTACLPASTQGTAGINTGPPAAGVPAITSRNLYAQYHHGRGATAGAPLWQIRMADGIAVAPAAAPSAVQQDAACSLDMRNVPVKSHMTMIDMMRHHS